ncbi:MAG: DUF2325 domain-containing protein [Pseudomonadota bacterium]
MCDKHRSLDPAGPAFQARQGSRRRRLWELSRNCHCPLIGVGLPLSVLRRLVEKTMGGELMHDDYEVHVGAVSDCTSRNRLAEAVQKELDRRYATVVFRFRTAKTASAVAALWEAAVDADDVAGAFWAGLTHPACVPELEEKMCRDIHMVQHQAGACARADMGKYRALLADKTRLETELARLQARCNALLQEKKRDSDRSTGELMQARAAAIGKDTEIFHLRRELAQLRASIPELETRKRLANRLAGMEMREQALRAQIAALKGARQDGPPGPGEAAAPADAAAMAAHGTGQKLTMPIRLVNQSVLCVGGRSGNVSLYRRMIERVGAQFAHHDGGIEDSSRQLEASLAAADLVICQTGCISHGAYWRVKDYCKRTGKRCVYVDNPSVSSLARGLQEIGAPGAPDGASGADEARNAACDT